MSEQVGSVTRKKSSDFHGGIRFQSSFTIRWELEDKTFLKIDIINFIPFSNSVTFRKPRGTDLVTASELIPGFCRSKSNVPIPGSLRTIKSPTGGQSQASNPRPLPALPPHGIYIDRCITWMSVRMSTIKLNTHCICCGSILSLVQILFPFVLGYGNVC